MRLPPVIRRLQRDQRGATIIEFAIISGPMLLLLMGGLELGYDSYVRSTMQSEDSRTRSTHPPAM